MASFFDPLFGVACALIIATSVLRLRGSRDQEGRRQHPNAVILITYVFIHAVLFVALSVSLTVLIQAFGERYGELLAGVLNFLQLEALVGDQPEAAAPILVFFLFMLIDSFAPLRSLDEGLRQWLFESAHRNDDSHELETCLISGPFAASDIERARNVATLREHHIFLTDDDTRFIDGSTNNLWRKVSTLLRHLEAWRASDRNVLSAAEDAELEELLKTHQRKTRHAMNLLRIVVRMRGAEADGGRARQVVSAEVEKLADGGAEAPGPGPAPGSGREAEARPEAAALADSGPFLPDQDPTRAAGRDADRPLVLSSEEFADHLRSIQGYFSVEYQLLLQRIARLTARSVIFAGDRGPQRFEQIKRTGFGGLGYLEPFNFNWILWAFLFIGVGMLMILFALTEYVAPALNPELAARRAAEGGPPRHLFLIIPLQMAFATLAGAIVGSNRRLARAGRETPWVAFLGAGCATLLIWLILQQSAAALFAAPETAETAQRRGLANVWPFAVISFTATLGVARLSHLRWPWSRGVHGGAAWSTRIADMAAMALVMIAAYALAIVLHQVAGTGFGQNFAKAEGLRPFLFPLIMGVLSGTLIGSVIADVRRAARSEITLTPEIAADIAYDEQRARASGALPAAE